MKYTQILVIATLCLISALASCGGGKKTSKSEAYVDTVPDSTLRVMLNKHTEDSLFVTDIETNGKHRFSYAQARLNGQIMGSLTDGDTLAIMPDFKQRTIRSSVNLSQLIGLWLYGQNQDGFRLNPDGGAFAIGNQGEDVLRSWKVKNGLFILTYVKANGSDYTERGDTSTIVRLEDNSFTFVFDGKEHTCRKITGLITNP